MNKESYYTWHLSLRVDRPVEVRILFVLALGDPSCCACFGKKLSLDSMACYHCLSDKH